MTIQVFPNKLPAKQATVKEDGTKYLLSDYLENLKSYETFLGIPTECLLHI